MFLVSPARIGSSFQVSLFTFFGETYVLESANSLTNPDWASRSSLFGDGTIRTLSDPLPADATGWYRVRNEQ